MRKRGAESAVGLRGPQANGLGPLGAKDTMGIPGWASAGIVLSLALSRAADDRQHLCNGTIQVVVDYHVVVVARASPLLLGDPQSFGHILISLAATQLLASRQLLVVGRGNEDENA